MTVILNHSDAPVATTIMLSTILPLMVLHSNLNTLTKQSTNLANKREVRLRLMEANILEEMKRLLRN
mgnify:CR=1 FL=1